MEYKVKNNFFAMGKLYKAGTTQEIADVVAEKNKQYIEATEKVVEKKAEKKAEKKVKKNGTHR